MSEHAAAPDMVERVARAMFDSSELPWKSTWDGGGTNRGYYRRQARAAIEAMREPTEAMINATDPMSAWSTQRAFYPSQRSAMWKAMIDAALSPLPEPPK